MSMDGYDEVTGEVMAMEVVHDAASWVAKQDAAILDVQVATAKRYPRSIQKFQSDLESWCCLNRETAIECFFAMPRDGKQVIGPSIRIAELIQAAYGNLIVDAQVIDEAREYVLVAGTCRDLERNIASRAQVRRNIMTKSGRRYGTAMIETTTMAAMAIARRNAIFQVVPKALWNPLYEKARKVAQGDAATFGARKTEILKGLKESGVDTANIKHFLGGKDNKDVSADELLLLEIKLRAIRANEITVDRAFPGPELEDASQGKGAVQATDALANAAKGASAKPKPPIDEADRAFGLVGESDDLETF